MSYGQILRRISRLFQSSVNSLFEDKGTEDAKAFDEELRRAQREAGNPTGSDSSSDRGAREEERIGRDEQRRAHGPGQGKRKPGERDDEFYFAVLGLTPSATDDEIKKTYRKLMAQYHPDRVATLGPELQRTAAEKTKEINEAYMIIERRRGMK